MKDLLYLSNILESIEMIEDYLRDKSFSDLEKSTLLRDAVCKRIEEVGENMRKISPKLIKSNPQIEWQAFIETRNFLTHVYQMVNLQKLWNILKQDLLVLKKQIRDLIKQVEKK